MAWKQTVRAVGDVLTGDYLERYAGGVIAQDKPGGGVAGEWFVVDGSLGEDLEEPPVRDGASGRARGSTASARW